MTATHPADGRPETLPTWRTEDLYPDLNSPALLADLDRLRAGVTDLTATFDRLGVAQGNPGQTAATIQATYEAAILGLNAVLADLSPVRNYLSAFTSTDSRNDLAQARMGDLITLSQPLGPLNTRLSAWLGDLSDAQAQALLDCSEVARAHRYRLEVARRQARHLLSPAEEELLAHLSSSGPGGWSKLRGNYSSSLTGEVQGKRLPVTAIRNLAGDERAEVRQAAYDEELRVWQGAEVVLAAAMNGIKGQASVTNQRRGYPDDLQPALDSANIDRETLGAMQAAVTASFPDFRRYLTAKARYLGHPDGRLPWADLMAPVGRPGREWSYAEGARFVEESFRGYSDRLGDFAARAFAEDWLDVPPREGKTGGAFCMGWRDGESRILLNYAPSLDQVSTLAHELGHGYHNLCLQGRTPLQKTMPMTLAETASIFCETLVQHRALEGSSGPERLYALETMLMGQTQVVVDIHSRFLFEREVFGARRARDLSATELCCLMAQAQRDTYGEALATLHPYMWAAKPHYYSSSFYNFPYTFGLLFGLGLYARYRQDPGNFQAGYDDLLSRTGLADAATLAAGFGIDTRSEAFWVSSLDVIRERIGEYVTLAG